MRIITFLAGLATVSLLGGTATAVAEPQADSLDEIVVTARKAEERLIDVPLAITALSDRIIEERGIRNLDDVAANTPGLQFSNVLGEFLPSPVIRGVAPIDILGENNTAIFIDGIYVSAREGLNFSQLDLERIEVVKGPQAAMYGRNSFSGAINYVTAKPTDTFKGKTEVTWGNDGKLLASISASGPLIEGVLRGRAAVLYDNFDGSYKNQWAGPGPGPDIGGYQYKTFQGSLLWTPTDNFEGTLSLYVSDDQIDNSALSAVASNCENRNDANPALSSRLLNYCGELPSVGRNDLSVIAGATGEDRDATRATMSLKWTLGNGGTINSLSGYSNVSQSFWVDGGRGGGNDQIYTYLASPIIPAFLGPPPAFNSSATRAQFRTGLLQIGPGATTEEFSQELRYSSDPTQRFTWSIGGYYYDTTSKAGIDDVVANTALPNNFGSFCLACTYLGPGLGWVDFATGAGDAAFMPWFTSPTGASIAGNVFQNDTKAPSAFVQFEFDLTDKLSWGAEARYTEEEKTFTDHQAGGTSRKVESELVNWRTNLRYQPSDSLTFYGAIAHAEKGGGSDAAQVQFRDAPTVSETVLVGFDPEDLLSYELGLKSEFLNRRLGIEFDVYYMDWSEIVIPQVLEVIDGRELQIPTAFSVNGGDASIKGAELAVTAHPVVGLDLNLGLSYIDGKYDDAKIQSFIDFPSFAPDGDVSGKKILRQSEWQWNVGAGYSAIARGDTNWFVRTDASYRGKQFADSSNQAILPESLLLNASLGLRGDRWSLELWGRNLTDEDAPTGAFRDVYFTNTLPDGTSAGGTFFPLRYTVNHPRLRTYGLTWRMKF